MTTITSCVLSCYTTEDLVFCKVRNDYNKIIFYDPIYDLVLSPPGTIARMLIRHQGRNIFVVYVDGTKDSKFRLLDSNGQQILPFNFTGFVFFSFEEHGLLGITREGQYYDDHSVHEIFDFLGRAISVLELITLNESE